MAGRPKWNSNNAAVKRILQEAQEIARENSDQFWAAPLDDDLFEWHFSIRGPPDSAFSDGIYHGRILLPAQYPFQPPDLIFLTPNGRFDVGKKICLSVSAFHPETWRPGWGIRSLLLALISFLPTPGEGAIGALDFPDLERRRLAHESQTFVCPTCHADHSQYGPRKPGATSSGTDGVASTHLDASSSSPSTERPPSADGGATPASSSPSSAAPPPAAASPTSQPPPSRLVPNSPSDSQDPSPPAGMSDAPAAMSAPPPLPISSPLASSPPLTETLGGSELRPAATASPPTPSSRPPPALDTNAPPCPPAVNPPSPPALRARAAGSAPAEAPPPPPPANQPHVLPEPPLWMAVFPPAVGRVLDRVVNSEQGGSVLLTAALALWIVYWSWKRITK